MKALLRFIIALIFIASGFVKAIDSVGFSFKLEEYFSPAVFNMPFLEKYALPIAVFVSAFEIILGVMLLLKIQLKKTLIALIALCVFFAFLTFYSAYFNVVTDCGCFGDAIKFTPWQSFWKDIVLLLGLILVWLLYKKEHDFEKSAGCLKSPLLWLSILITAFIIYWGIQNEPLIDFRDYKIGTNLNIEKKKLDENPSEYKTFYVLKNKQTGEEKKVDQDEYINDESLWKEGSPWELLSDKTMTELTKQGYETEIMKFKIVDENGSDFTDQILKAEKAVLLFSYHPQFLTKEEITAAENKVKGNAHVYGVSNMPKTFSQIPSLIMDATAIKTIARSNPFVLVLNKGKIVEKKPIKDF